LNTVAIPRVGASEPVSGGFFSSATRDVQEGLSFSNSGLETRPTNMAVRIWERL
jgi:hypothetical protein